MHRIIIVLLLFLISIQWTIGLCKLIFNWAPLIFTQFEPHDFTCSEPCYVHIKRPIFWKLPGFGIYNMNFLITEMIQFVSGKMRTFSQRGAAKLRSKQFSEFGSRTKSLSQILSIEIVCLFYLGKSVHTFFCKKLVLNFLPNHNRNTRGCCPHNNREQRKIKKLSLLRLDLSF